MLFNIDLCDAICEVQIRLKVTGDMSNSRFYKYVSRKDYNVDCTDAQTFNEQLTFDDHAIKLIMADTDAGKWILDNFYEEFIVKSAPCLGELIANLAIKHDDREFIDHYAGKEYEMMLLYAAMLFGTLDQMHYLRTICDFSKIKGIDSVIKRVVNLDIMKYIYSVRPDLFTGFRERGFLSLLHCSVLVKRDLQTLEWLIDKLGVTMGNTGFDECDSDDTFNFFAAIIKNGDESLFEWICINRSNILRPAFKHLTNRADILCHIAVNLPHRLFLLFVERVYPEHNPTDNHADMLKNLQYIVK